VTRAAPPADRPEPGGRRGRPQPPYRINRWVRGRIYGVAVLITAGLGAVAWRAYGMQIGEAERYRRMAERQHFKTIEVAAARGPIYDVQGRELAVSVDVDSVVADPRAVVDVTGTAEALSRVLGLDRADLEAKLASRRRFVWIERHVTAEQAAAIRALDLAGVDLRQEPRRYYPGRGLACSVIGFADVDGHGVEGVEASLDELLTGKSARLDALRDARGRTLLPGAAEAEPGTAVTLTLDRSIQSFTESALAEAITQTHAHAGVAIVVDVASGGVLAMADYPAWDPNDPATLARNHARNRAVTDAYEIGSGMKVFAISAALDAGVVKPTTVIDVQGGEITIGRKTIRDSNHDDELDIGGILKRSSNVGAVKVTQILGAERLHDALLRFGFGTETGIELTGERSGTIRPPQRWGKIGLATISFGYGMTATPLQVVAALAAIGNRGIYHEPRIIERVTSAAGKVVYQRRPVGRRVLAEKTAVEITDMISHVFDKGRHGGTARGVTVPGYRAGGKTGTARKVDRKSGTYSEDRYLSSFIGLAPIDQPRIAVLVLLDEPQGHDYYGGVVAAPVFAHIVSDTLRYLGVPAEVESDPPADAAEPAAAEAPPGDSLPAAGQQSAEIGDGDAGDPPGADGGVAAPDFRGLGMAAAVERAAAAGLEIEVEGSGRAASQTPPPGARVDRGRVHVVFTDE